MQQQYNDIILGSMEKASTPKQAIHSLFKYPMRSLESCDIHSQIRTLVTLTTKISMPPHATSVLILFGVLVVLSAVLKVKLPAVVIVSLFQSTVL